MIISLTPFCYNPHALAGTTKIENGIMPPPPRRAMCPARNRRRLNWPVPIARRGRGSAEVDLKTTFSYNGHVLADTTKIENGIMPPPPRWAIGTGQLSCLQFRSGTIARRGGGGIIPFGSASTTLYLLCPPGHVGYTVQLHEHNRKQTWVWLMGKKFKSNIFLTRGE